MNLERCLVISFENFQLSRCELASQNDSGTDVTVVEVQNLNIQI